MGSYSLGTHLHWTVTLLQWWAVTKYIYFVTLLKYFILKSTCNEVHF